VTDTQDGTIATLTAFSYPNVTMSYVENGLEVPKEGVSTFVDFMSPGSGPATFSAGGYLRGIGRQVTGSASHLTNGTLDSTIWRVLGLNGPSSGADPCYYGTPAQAPTSLNAGKCGTFWGYGNPYYKINDGAVYPMYDDQDKLFSMDSAWIDSETFTTSNPPLSNTDKGGLLSFKVGSEQGGLGFHPHYGASSTSDLLPGYLDMRLHNSMAQTITGLGVRYSLQCRNMYAASTTISLEYTHVGGDEWYFTPVPGTSHTTAAACSGSCPTSCGAADSTCWDSNKAVDVEITGLDWKAETPFFLRWTIESTADATNADGDICRMTDIEIIPFVYESGDLSLKFAPGAANGVDINYAEVLASENYTIAMTVYPAGHEFATDTTNMPRPGPSSPYTLVSSYDDATNVELNWVMSPLGVVSVTTTLPTPTTIWTSTATIPFDQWTSVALLHSYSDVGHVFKVYLGGVWVSESGTINSLPPFGGSTGNGTVRVGRRARADAVQDPYYGLMDEFQLWSKLRTDTEIYQDQDNKLLSTSDSALMAYFHFDSYHDGTTPNSATSSSLSAVVYNTSVDHPLSKISSSTLLSLTGGSVSCYDQHVITDGRVTCNFTVFNQFGQAKPTFDTSEFDARVIQGGGVIGPLDPDSTGVVWTFTFFAANYTGPSYIQVYTRHGDPLNGAPATIWTIPEVCRACEFRKTVTDPQGQSFDLFSCQSGGRRFLRRGNLVAGPTGGGICPQPGVQYPSPWSV
jgi:hypothetical protein